MHIRLSRSEDVPALLKIFEAARIFMVSQGNKTQWPPGYPSEEILRRDITASQSYVVEFDGRPVGTFVLAFGDEPTYGGIEDGHWPDNAPYATIHRQASNGMKRGVADDALEFAIGKLRGLGLKTLRLDTHADNRKMLEWAEGNGFEYCGVIRVANGTPRRAYQLVI